MAIRIDGENQRAFRRLRTLLRNEQGSFVGLLGAGASAASPDRYPVWPKLIGDLHDETERLASRSDLKQLRFLGKVKDAPVRAQLYRSLLSERQYNQFLVRTFAPRKGKVSDISRAIARLPLKRFVTTNYENVMPRACKSVGDPVRCIDWDDSLGMQEFYRDIHRTDCDRTCVYLHGNIERPETIVLTEEDYLRQYVRSEESKRKLFVLFATKRVLFIGFSLGDPDLMFLQREAWATISDSQPRHFALVGWGDRNWADDDPSARRVLFTRKYGIEPVFYPVRGDDGSDHSKLKDVLESLLKPGVKIPIIPQLYRPKSAKAQNASPATAEHKATSYDSDDPQKYRWGGVSFSPDRRVQAKVTPIKGYPDWFNVALAVQRLGGPPVKGPVRFHLHPSFYPQVRSATVRKGKAELTLEAFGAFTVGVEADGGKTRLELDLASDEVDAPALFKSK